MNTTHATWSMTDADTALLERTVDPYRSKEAVYLQEAWVEVIDGQVVATGQFGIDEPCYIDDTGHFNAVESIICLNQLLYYAFARSVRDGLIPEFAHWTLDDYWDRQLPDVYIYRQEIRYRRPIEASSFQAEFRVLGVDSSAIERAMLKVASSIAFTDGHGGDASGTVDLTFVNVPQAPR